MIRIFFLKNLLPGGMSEKKIVKWDERKTRKKWVCLVRKSALLWRRLDDSMLRYLRLTSSDMNVMACS